MRLTPEKIEQAKQLRELEWGWDKIACHLDVSVYKLRCELQAGYADRRNSANQIATANRRARVKQMVQQDKAARAARVTNAKKAQVNQPTAESIIGHIYPMHIPERVLSERERRRELSHASFTAAWQGDPLPGYSALDRRRQA